MLLVNTVPLLSSEKMQIGLFFVRLAENKSDGRFMRLNCKISQQSSFLARLTCVSVATVTSTKAHTKDVMISKYHGIVILW